ncbi:Dps family protein [Streptomyces sp. NPDC006978]|uniref:Dps family protein n=1 Tax=Streptomyces sp. NPDC006978 TaxID=3364769 RepID=UPI00369A5DFD
MCELERDNASEGQGGGSAPPAVAAETAERISALGGEPQGTPGVLVAERTWKDYSVGRADAIAHLGALDLVYTGVIKDHRAAVSKAGSIDPVTEDLLVGHLRSLELFQWFVRAHLESAGGDLSTAGAATEEQAAKAASSTRTTAAKRPAKKGQQVQSMRTARRAGGDRPLRAGLQATEEVALSEHDASDGQRRHELMPPRRAAR